MPYGDRITTSLHGRRLGLQHLSSAESGGARGTEEYLVGPQAFRALATSAETTAANIPPYGVSHSTEAAATILIDPPVPGVMKSLSLGSSVTAKLVNGAFISSAGTTHTVIESSGACVLMLVGLSTAAYQLHTNGANLSFATST